MISNKFVLPNESCFAEAKHEEFIRERRFALPNELLNMIILHEELETPNENCRSTCESHTVIFLNVNFRNDPIASQNYFKNTQTVFTTLRCLNKFHNNILSDVSQIRKYIIYFTKRDIHQAQTQLTVNYRFLGVRHRNFSKGPSLIEYGILFFFINDYYLNEQIPQDYDEFDDYRLLTRYIFYHNFGIHNRKYGLISY